MPEQPEHVVAVPFNTPSRRFKVGATVTESDLADDQLGFTERKRAKHIVNAETRAGERVLERADELQEKAEASAEAGEDAARVAAAGADPSSAKSATRRR